VNELLGIAVHDSLTLGEPLDPAGPRFRNDEERPPAALDLEWLAGFEHAIEQFVDVGSEL
jgi:hypothetical protein